MEITSFVLSPELMGVVEGSLPATREMTPEELENINEWEGRSKSHFRGPTIYFERERKRVCFRNDYIDYEGKWGTRIDLELPIEIRWKLGALEEKSTLDYFPIFYSKGLDNYSAGEVRSILWRASGVESTKVVADEPFVVIPGPPWQNDQLLSPAFVCLAREVEGFTKRYVEQLQALAMAKA